VSDIPAADGNIGNLFLQCILPGHQFRFVKIPKKLWQLHVALLSMLHYLFLFYISDGTKSIHSSVSAHVYLASKAL